MLSGDSNSATTIRVSWRLNGHETLPAELSIADVAFEPGGQVVLVCHEPHRIGLGPADRLEIRLRVVDPAMRFTETIE